MQTVNLKFNQRDYVIHLRDEVDQSVFNEIFKFEEYRCAKEKIKQAKAPIFDVGAHIGLFSLYCRALNPVAMIYAWEPENNNLKALAENVEVNKLSNIKIVPAALGDQTGEEGLILSADNHNHHLAGYGDINNQVQPVKVFSLGDFCRQNKIERIALLKMDIEGGEYRIINSLAKDNWPTVESIVLEYHNSRFQDYKQLEQKLRENRFSVQNFPSQFDKNMGFLWAVNKKAMLD